jgi:hypothetical protein
MTDPLGDPIDPNEQLTEPPPLFYPADFGYGVPPGYGPPPGYGAPPGYGPPPGYRPPPDYGPSPDARPGGVMASAVLALITSGLLLITGFVVIFAAGSLDTSDFDSQTAQRTTLFVIAGLGNVLAAAVLIMGAVLLLNRSKNGRTAVAIGAMLCFVLGVFWMAEDQQDDGIVVWLLIFCVPSATAALLAATTRVGQWLRSAPPYPA